ncbi:hypothetical protein HJC23_008455 [Cyclotella cryptica]|uniref:Peptidase S1 domain-containing protein n=1 Tax=Cyclotella cryptica TaxID=29204 RepID=A0ABD3QW90_9STRA
MIYKICLFWMGMVACSDAALEFQNQDDTSDLPPQNIIGGVEIQPGSRPYLVSLGVDGMGYTGHWCGGSLISPHAVMTTADCLFLSGQWHPPIYVDLHRYNLTDDTGVTRMHLNDISQCDGDVVYHPDYQPGDVVSRNNVAILFLPEAVTDITPIKLNDDPNLPSSEGDPLDIAGWGATSGFVPINSNVPMAVTLEYVSREACTKKPYRWAEEYVKDTMFCGIAQGKGPCYGDGGGPVVLGKPESQGGGPSSPPVQVGIFSWGIRFFASNPVYDMFPNVFTSVSTVVGKYKQITSKRDSGKTKFFLNVFS